MRWTTTARIWDAERLRAWVSQVYSGGSIVVLANRQPFRHEYTPDGDIVASRSAGGLVTALEPLMQACSAVWVAHGAGTADRVVVDERDGLDVPPSNPRYRLRRVWLDAREERGYYYGFANEGLWPLCHRARVAPVFRPGDFALYRAINMRFAAAACEEVEGETPVVLVQDYHLALAPRAIRQRLPHGTIISFWHIPWPAPREFANCPWGRRLIEGLVGSTIVGFQTSEDCQNFLDCAEFFLDAHVDRQRSAVTSAGLETVVRAYPVSIEWPSRLACESPPVEACRSTVRRRLRLPPDVRLGVGVDRLDYTKGLNEKFLAVEQLLESYPEYRGRFVFVQIAEPSRECLPAYRELRQQIRATANRINVRYGTDCVQPIVLLEQRHEPAAVYEYFRAADVCYVGSLHDGMNLVAKEFVSARDDERGVLILSRFAGAARQLTAALIVDPLAIGDAARALADALSMTDEEQAIRMQTLRSIVAEFNAYRWAGEMLADASRLRADLSPVDDGWWRRRRRANNLVNAGQPGFVIERRGVPRAW